jgi:hypothetical protein
MGFHIHGFSFNHRFSFPIGFTYGYSYLIPSGLADLKSATRGSTLLHTTDTFHNKHYSQFTAGIFRQILLHALSAILLVHHGMILFRDGAPDFLHTQSNGLFL